MIAPVYDPRRLARTTPSDKATATGRSLHTGSAGELVVEDDHAVDVMRIAALVLDKRAGRSLHLLDQHEPTTGADLVINFLVQNLAELVELSLTELAVAKLLGKDCR